MSDAVSPSLERPGPHEDLTQRTSLTPEVPGFTVDLRRCIGCHACSVACKTAHDVPLGEFPIRVRWLPKPDGQTYAFLPVFSETLCHNDQESLAVGMAPACARACPTDALVFKDFGEQPPTGSDARRLQSLDVASAQDLKDAVTYIGLEDWMSKDLNQGAALDPNDPDPIYEQR